MLGVTRAMVGGAVTYENLHGRSLLHGMTRGKKKTLTSNGGFCITNVSFIHRILAAANV